MHRRLIDLVDTLTNITKDLPHCGRSGFGPTCVNAFAGWFCAKYNLASERFVSGCQIRFPNQHGFQCFANSASDPRRLLVSVELHDPLEAIGGR